jgi:hypothetical protein
VKEHPFLPEHFERLDENPDPEFYEVPRLVVHIDDAAIAAVESFYRDLLPPGGVILDLMSSWRSHLPPDFEGREVVGLGMNAVEMAENPRLTRAVVHDLNADPHLPFASDTFDAAIVTVSVQYLVNPLAIFAEVHRVLRPGGTFAVTFSNRCFPTKAVRIWRELNDSGHLQLVAAYFRYSAEWAEVMARQPATSGDPIYAVSARKPVPASSAPRISRQG